jgi:hypothetical protein
MTHKRLKIESLSHYSTFPLDPQNLKRHGEIQWINMGSKSILQLIHRGKKEMWIMAYFKELYCGPLISTQQSESTNRVLKDSFVNRLTSLHQFAEKMLEAL